jgi:hypothetical protein
MSDDPEGLVTLAEAARRLRRDPEGLRALIRRGKLTAKRGNDGRLLVRLADLPAGVPNPVEDELRDRLAQAEADRDRWRQTARADELAGAPGRLDVLP